MTDIHNIPYGEDSKEMLDTVNISDPKELEAHLEIRDVKERVRERRRKTILCFATVLVVIVAIATIIGVTTKGNDNNNNTKQSNINTQTLVDPPLDLESRCSVAQINTQGGYQGCESACEVAECCNFSQDFALSCQQLGNEQVCQQYQQHCVILENNYFTLVPSMEEQGTEPLITTKEIIDAACQGSTIHLCEQLCHEDQVGPCCFGQTPTSCRSAVLDLTSVYCQTYASCTVVFADDTADTNVPTKADVDDACANYSPNNDEWANGLCEQVCQEDQVGPCCFGQTPTSCRSAVLDPTSAYCQTYASCSAFFYNTSDTTTTSPQAPPQPSPDLAQVCANPSERPTCIAQCSEATCCHATTTPDTCNRIHPGIECDDFSPCNVLYGL